MKETQTKEVMESFDSQELEELINEVRVGAMDSVIIHDFVRSAQWQVLEEVLKLNIYQEPTVNVEEIEKLAQTLGITLTK